MVKTETHRMGVAVNIQCDLCRTMVYLGREEKFAKLAEAMNHRMGDENWFDADAAALVEAHARGWRRDTQVQEKAVYVLQDHCPECVEKRPHPKTCACSSCAPNVVDNSMEAAV